MEKSTSLVLSPKRLKLWEKDYLNIVLRTQGDTQLHAIIQSESPNLLN